MAMLPLRAERADPLMQSQALRVAIGHGEEQTGVVVDRVQRGQELFQLGQ